MRQFGLRAAAVGILEAWQSPTPEPEPASFANTLGIKMIRIRSGEFLMGSARQTQAEALGQDPLLVAGDYDEKPVRRVRITTDFYISETEITAEQFSRFRYDLQNLSFLSPYAAGVSWEDAVAPENQFHDAIVAAGLHPALLGHNHSAGLTIAPNGDVLAIFFLV